MADVELPRLPKVTQEQADRILAAYKIKFGTESDADTAAAFKKHQLARVVEDVLAVEASRKRTEAEATVQAELAAMRETLPPTMTPEEQVRAEVVAAQIQYATERTTP